MRLIDADALIFELEEWKKNPNNDDSAVDLVNHFIGIIRATPSADAVEVVRCGECRHKYMKDFDMFCPHMVGIIKPNMHCSYGERREP